jgi:hypothetical protein
MCFKNTNAEKYGSATPRNFCLVGLESFGNEEAKQDHLYSETVIWFVPIRNAIC